MTGMFDRLNVGKIDIRENEKQLLAYQPTENPCDLSYKYYELYWGKIKSENELINQRVTWFVLMNSFLFTAVGVILSTKTLGVPSRTIT